VAVAFFGSLLLSWCAKVKSAPEVSEPPGPPTTEGLVGYPSKVDPVQALQVARGATRRTTLHGFVAEKVHSDGTLDLTEEGARVRYLFQSPAGEGPQPPRPEGTLARRLYCGKQNVHLRQEGVVADPDVADYPCSPHPPEALPEPRCTPADVWELAIEKGANPAQPARIEYYRAKVGPAWRFQQPGSRVRFSVYGDCGRELDAREAIGAVR